MNRIASANRTPWWIATVIMVILAVASLADLANTPFGGFFASGGTRISQVAEGGPAQAAGLEVGDEILVTDGIDTSDLHALFRQPRATVGEARQLVVEREGEAAPLELAVTYTELPTVQKALTLGAALIGFAFLCAGIGAFFRAPSHRSRLLAWLGIVAMAVFVTPPYLAHAELRLFYSLVPLVATMLLPALIVHFLLNTPRRRRFLDRGIALWLLYGPAAVAGLLGFATFFVRPQLLQTTIFVATAVPVALLLIAIVLLGVTYWRASPSQRATQGLGVLLLGFTIGLLPVILSGLVPSLPGGQFYFLTLILVPLALAYTELKNTPEPLTELQPEAF
ncbi:MAG: PDZ domain-containing protein [Acidobacteriota bacterium]